MRGGEGKCEISDRYKISRGKVMKMFMEIRSIITLVEKEIMHIYMIKTEDNLV